MGNFLSNKTKCAITLLVSACSLHAATVIYSDNFARETVSDTEHNYTTQGLVSVANETLRLVCPKDGSAGHNLGIKR